MKEVLRAEYLDDPAYDLGCNWVVQNLPRVRALIPDTIIDKDGFVIDGSSRFRLEALRQIGTRQDGDYYGVHGPVVGVLDVAIVERVVADEENYYSDDKWAVAVFVRPTITHIGRTLREIELCRHGLIKDSRVSIESERYGGGGFIKGMTLPFVIISSGVKHRDTITSQGFIYHSCSEAFVRPSIPVAKKPPKPR
jgi:hypothetical protein